MRTLLAILLLLGGLLPAARAEISPASVAILYNSTVPDSRKLAEIYREARGIPEENVIALDMPTAATIARDDYERSILKPLRRQFEARGWWRRQQDAGGLTVPVANKIRVLVTIRGVPLRISQTPPKPAPQPKPGEAPKPQDPLAGRDDASVDSELSMFGIEGLPPADLPRAT
ncbi:MAG: TIGR03790 family protein, partial [Verrucomicrobiaceae bacterium]